MNTPIKFGITRAFIWDWFQLYTWQYWQLFSEKEKYWCIDFTNWTNFVKLVMIADVSRNFSICMCCIEKLIFYSIIFFLYFLFFHRNMRSICALLAFFTLASGQFVLPNKRACDNSESFFFLLICMYKNNVPIKKNAIIFFCLGKIHLERHGKRYHFSWLEVGEYKLCILLHNGKSPAIKFWNSFSPSNYTLTIIIFNIGRLYIPS